jgi:alpha-ketoglutarate-dependent taurine dioxygenase
MPEPGALSFQEKLAGRTRKPVQISSDNLVTVGPLLPNKAIPQLVRPTIAGVDFLGWTRINQNRIATLLLEHGAVLFRGFNAATAEMFESFAETTSTGGLIEYTYCSTPRRRVQGGVYTSTEYPADQSIPFHNEMSYSASWPMKIWFCCLRAAERGGATPIADSAKVFARIEPRIRAKFMEHGVMYVRNYRDKLDLSCSEVFGTDDRMQIEKFCQEAGIQCEFGANGHLRTKQVCQAVAVHPVKGHRLWFNQAHLFHVSSLGESTAAALLAEFGKDGVPRNACYGDGSTIDEAELNAVRVAYSEEAVSFPWERGDVLMLDNMAVAHAREPFHGERKIVVAMAEPNSAGVVASTAAE